MAQFFIPSADITLTEISGGYTSIDETTANDGDYVSSNDSTDATYEFRISINGGNFSDPQVNTGHIVRLRWGKADTNVAPSTDGNTQTGTAYLYQGTTLIATLGTNSNLGSFTTLQYTLSGSEADAITNYSDLRIRVVFPNGGGGNPTVRRGGAVSWAQMEVPSSNRLIGTSNGDATTEGLLTNKPGIIFGTTEVLFERSQLNNAGFTGYTNTGTSSSGQSLLGWKGKIFSFEFILYDNSSGLTFGNDMVGEIWSVNGSGVPQSLLETSINSFSDSDIDGSLSYRKFIFSGTDYQQDIAIVFNFDITAGQMNARRGNSNDDDPNGSIVNLNPTWATGALDFVYRINEGASLVNVTGTLTSLVTVQISGASSPLPPDVLTEQLTNGGSGTDFDNVTYIAGGPYLQDIDQVVSRVKVNLRALASPVASFRMSIYSMSGNLPDQLLESSVETYDESDLTLSFQEFTFTFSDTYYNQPLSFIVELVSVTTIDITNKIRIERTSSDLAGNRGFNVRQTNLSYSFFTSEGIYKIEGDGFVFTQGTLTVSVGNDLISGTTDPIQKTQLNETSQATNSGTISYVGQKILSFNNTINNFSLQLRESVPDVPTFNMHAEIWSISGGLPDTLLETSINSISTDNLTGSYQWFDFFFSGTHYNQDIFIGVYFEAFGSGQIQYRRTSSDVAASENEVLYFSSAFFNQGFDLTYKINSIFGVLSSGTLTGKGGLVGVVTTSTTTESNLQSAQNIEPIAGIINGVATIAGILTANGILQGVINGIATVNGIASARGDLEVVSNGSITTSGTLSANGELAGSSNGVTTTESNLTAGNVIAQISGESNGSVVVNGLLTGNGSLEGTINNTSSTTSVLSANGQLAGSSNGIVTTSGLLNSNLQGSVIVNTTTNTSATLTGSGALLGTSNGIATVNGSLASNALISGESNGSTSTTSVLTGSGQLIGESNGVTSTSSSLTSNGELTGETNGIATVSGLLNSNLQGSVIINTTTNTSATLTGSGALIGTSSGVTSTDSFLTSLQPIEGTVNSSTTVSGSLSANGSIEGISTTNTTVTGQLIGLGSLIGTVTTSTTTQGILNATGSLNGSSNGSTTTQGFVVSNNIYGESNGSSIVSGLLNSNLQGSVVVDTTTNTSGTLTGTGSLTGEINSTTVLNGNLSSDLNGSGTINGSTTIQGVLNGKGSLAATINSATTTQGNLTGQGTLLGVINSSSTITGVLTSQSFLTGTSDALGSVSGILTAIGLLEGTIDNSTILQGSLISDAIEGVSNGTTIISGILNGNGSLAGISSGQADTNGNVISDAIAGISNGTATTQGELSAIGNLSGVINSSTTTQGAIQLQIFGTSNGSTSVSGTLIGIGLLNGASNGSSLTSGDMNSLGVLEGQSNGSTTTSIQLSGTGNLAGISEALPYIAEDFGIYTESGSSTSIAEVTTDPDNPSALGTLITNPSKKINQLYWRFTFGTGNGSGIVGSYTGEIWSRSGNVPGVLLETSSNSIDLSTITNNSLAFPNPDLALNFSGTVYNQDIFFVVRLNITSLISTTLRGHWRVQPGLIALGYSVNAGWQFSAGVGYIYRVESDNGGVIQVQGTLTANAQLSGQTNGSTTVQGIIEITAFADGTIDGSTTVEGVLSGKSFLESTINGSATVSGTLTGLGNLSGSSNGSATTTSQTGSSGQIVAISNGATTINATLMGWGALAGIIQEDPIYFDLGEGSLIAKFFTNDESYGETINIRNKAVEYIEFLMGKTGSPNFTMRAEIWSLNGSRLPNNLLQVSTNTIQSTSLVEGAYTYQRFNFDIVGVNYNQEVAIVVHIVNHVVGDDSNYVERIYGDQNHFKQGNIVYNFTGSLWSEELSQDINGNIQLKKGVTGNISGTVFGVVFGTTTVIGTLSSMGPLQGVSNGDSSAIGVLSHKIQGISSGNSNVTGILSGKGLLFGLSNGSSIVIGSVLSNGILVGSSNGNSSVSAILLGKVQMEAVSNASSSTNGTLIGIGNLLGEINGTSSLSLENTSSKGVLSGIINTLSIVTGTLSYQNKGSVNGSTIVNGTLTAKGNLSGTINTSSNLQGTFLSPIRGVSNGSTLITGTLSSIGKLEGTINGEAISIAVPNSVSPLIGTINGTTTVLGNVNSQGQLFGVINTYSQTAGTAIPIVDFKVKISGVSNGSSSLVGTLNTGDIIDTECFYPVIYLNPIYHVVQYEEKKYYVNYHC